MASTSLAKARECLARSRWDEACVLFLDADHAEALDVQDIESLAQAAQMCGRHDDAITALERSYTLRAQASDVEAAAVSAFWLFSEFLYGGEVGRAGGWVSRLRELSEGQGGPEPGWLLVARAYGCIGHGRYDDAISLLSDAAARGKDRGDIDLITFSTMLTGRSLLKEGRIEEGIGQLDVAMLAVTGAKTSPRVTSTLFCSGIGTCEEETLDLDRSREWALALERWMAGMPPSSQGAFLNNCRVYRAVLLRRRGAVQHALDELTAASHDLVEVHGVLVAGHACYELGETHRLLGHDREAEDAYRRASSLGASTQPGLALLRLGQGEVVTAEAGIRRALAEAEKPPERARLLPAAVRIFLAAGDMGAARASAAELGRIAEVLDSSAVRAAHTCALGQLALADGDASSALPPLRRAASEWRRSASPYEVACTEVHIARACQALGDEEAARLELESARRTFAGLGARPDLAMVDGALAPGPGASHGLTPRELEVLGLVADGFTNKAIAARLFLSERTVHRHVSNIFGKLDVRSRTEATAYAIKHRVVGGTTSRS